MTKLTLRVITNVCSDMKSSDLCYCFTANHSQLMIFNQPNLKTWDRVLDEMPHLYTTFYISLVIINFRISSLHRTLQDVLMAQLPDDCSVSQSRRQCRNATLITIGQKNEMPFYLRPTARRYSSADFRPSVCRCPIIF